MFGLAKLKLMLAAAGAVVVALGVAFLKGRQGAIKEAERKRLTDYKNTRKRMDEADTQDDPDAAREWLRNRNK